MKWIIIDKSKPREQNSKQGKNWESTIIYKAETKKSIYSSESVFRYIKYINKTQVEAKISFWNIDLPFMPEPFGFLCMKTCSTYSIEIYLSYIISGEQSRK